MEMADAVRSGTLDRGAGRGQERSIVASCKFAGDQIPGMPTKLGKALTRSIQLRTLA